MFYKTKEELFNKFQWKTPSKFIPLAKCYQFTEQQAKQHLASIIQYVKAPKAKYNPIVSQLGVSVSERTACGSNNSSMTELTQKALELDFKSGSLRIKLHLYIDSNKRV